MSSTTNSIILFLLAKQLGTLVKYSSFTLRQIVPPKCLVILEFIYQISVSIISSDTQRNNFRNLPGLNKINWVRGSNIIFPSLGKLTELQKYDQANSSWLRLHFSRLKVFCSNSLFPYTYTSVNMLQKWPRATVKSICNV